MKSHPSSTEPSPTDDVVQPNDDGCVLGTAGRDEDPNATTDWDRDSDSSGTILTPDDAHGLPGYPHDPEDDVGLPPNGRPEIDIETPIKDDGSTKRRR